MSINAKLNRLSLDLRNLSDTSSPSGPAKSSKLQSKSVAESWEDETLSDTEVQSPTSSSGEYLEAPGPDIKSPRTKAIDAERELAGELPENMPIPPPTPISPQLSGVTADWSPAHALGGGRPTYTVVSAYSNSTLPNNPRLTSVSNEISTNRQPALRERDLDRDRRRPEKTTATANRLIAGALGIKAPAKTEEQKQYERAIKEQEIKRRNKEKEERRRADEDDERAKAAMWEDS